MKVRQGKKWRCLRGDPTMTHAEASLRSVAKLVKSEGVGYLVELHRVELREGETDLKVEDEYMKILEEYPHVIVPIQGLPPRRIRDHAIIIKEGAQPSNIRPYRYGYQQKTEIEKMVRDRKSVV